MIRIGNSAMSREMKWVYEIIAETLPPFKWLPPVQNVLAQLLLMYGLAIFLFYFFQVPGNIVLYGFVGLFVVAAWSLFLLQLAPTIRGVKCPLEGKEKAFLGRYRMLLFHPRHFELYLGIAFFFIITGYLLLGPGNLMRYWFGQRLHPVLLFFFLVFTFDVAYRCAVAVWVSGLAIWRSLWLKRYIERRESMEYTPYTGLRNLRRLDLYNASFVLVSLPIFPTIWSDRLFASGLVLVDSFVLMSSVLSILLLRRIPWLPPDIYDLVYSSKFSYIGTSDRKMTPHVVPTSFIFDGMNLFFMTSVVSKKLKNIKETKRVAFLIDVRDHNDLLNNKAVLFIGRAKVYGLVDLLFHPIKLYNSRRLFVVKYPEYVRRYAAEKKNLPKAWQLTPLTSRLLVGVEPEKIVLWRKAEPIILPM
jgi:hypothetical protein